MKTALDILAAGLASRSAQALLIGGLALPAYGVVRQTVDVDLLLADADETIVLEILRQAGYGERQRTATFVRYSHESPLLMDVDVLLVDRATFDKLMDASQPYRIGETTFRVPAVAHLIALKLHAIRHNRDRELKDLSDIVELLRTNPRAVSTDDLQALCDRHGPPGIYQTLKSYL